MIGRLLTTGCVAAALALSPAERAEADAGEFIGGAIIGGIIGYAAGQNQGQRSAPPPVRGSCGPGIPATQQGRETQTALNYFGYDAGTVDGQIGAGTRAAIERFQASMGYPVNGREFASYQFDFLMDGYFWATQQGGAQQTGLRGPQLLYAYRDSLSGAPIQSTAPVQQVQPPATTVIVNPPGQGNAPATTVVGGGHGQLPNLFANSQPRMSLANACNAVMLQTSSNGGYRHAGHHDRPEPGPVGAVLRRAHLRHGAGRGPDGPDHRADARPRSRSNARPSLRCCRARSTASR
jgi:peptidoglycan hydrolase-like protein with peptidoglycan-binding domain